MKFLEKYDSFENSDEKFKKIKEFVEKKYTTDWLNEQFSELVYEYITEEEAEEYDGDYEQAYQELSTGGAVGYDLLDYMSKEVKEKFDIDEKFGSEEEERLSNLLNDHFIDSVEWYDRFIFSKSSEGYVSVADKFFGKSNDHMKGWDDMDTGDLKL